MRIAFLMNGMTGYLDAQYRELHELGNTLLVVSPGSGSAAGEAMANTDFSELGTDTYASVHFWDREPSARSLRAKVATFDPDAVLMTSWNYARSYRAVMKAVDPSVPRGLIMDNLWRSAPRQWLGRAVHRWYVDPVADFAFVPSDRTDQYARLLGFGPADVVRGSLSADTGLFGRPPRDGAELAAKRAFLYVGRFVWHKGVDVLAASYRAYRRRAEAEGVEPWDLHVVGTGPDEHHLADVPGVTMHGFLQPKEVASLMDEVSCFVLTSHIEPYGVVVHEAAAAALPILCTDFSGAGPMYVHDGANGWQVPTGSTDAWADAMVRMSTQDADRLGAMSQVSHGLAQRTSPKVWARNLHDELARRRAAGGGRLSTNGR